MHLQWVNILLVEFGFVLLVGIGLGFIRAPRFLMRRRLARGFPWGYYADQVPQGEQGYFQRNDQDFLHDRSTEFAGIEGFGDFGEFSGFGELGEFGNGFAGGDISGDGAGM